MRLVGMPCALQLALALVGSHCGVVERDPAWVQSMATYTCDACVLHVYKDFPATHNCNYIRQIRATLRLLMDFGDN